MKEKFDYKEVPEGYIHCLNEQCPRSSACLRFKAALLADQTVHYFKAINPSYAEANECRYFFPDTLIRYALGITHLYDNMSHTVYRKIKKRIHSYFGNTQYYRVYNKQRLIKPEEQNFIRELFLKEGIENEPLFDEYIEKYEFFSD